MRRWLGISARCATRSSTRWVAKRTGVRHMSVRALVSRKGDEGMSHEVVEVGSVAELPCQSDPAVADGGSLVRVGVKYSCVNYKDGIVLAGRPGVAKSYPLVGGIDAAGVVEEADVGSGFTVGQEVVLTGHYCGQHMDGGYAQQVMVPSAWLVPLPSALTCFEAMAIGTAGFTAMQSVMHLEAAGGLTPTCDLPVLVTGAAGGVGSVAVSILAHLGYNVTASSTRHEGEQGDMLRSLGAHTTMGRLEAGPPLNKERFQGVVDTVGGPTLAAALPQIAYGGAAATCGIAAGPTLEASMFPFILRGVRILGIDSVQAPRAERDDVWRRLTTDLPLDKLASAASTISLADVPAAGLDILKGKVAGRLVVDVNA